VPGRVGAEDACWRHLPDRWNHREARGGPVAGRQNARLSALIARRARAPPAALAGRDSEVRVGARAGQRRARPAFSLLNAQVPSSSPPAGWLRGLGCHSVPLATCQRTRPVDRANASHSGLSAPPQRWPGPGACTGPGPQPQPQ
jgi:hypothetical protein